MSLGWPVTLQYGDVTLRPLGYRDARAWRAVRRRNAAWLVPWDATVPPGGNERPATFRALVARLQRLARQGSCMPFAVEVEGRFAGQVTVNNIVRGSAQFASVGLVGTEPKLGAPEKRGFEAKGKAGHDRDQ